MTSISPDINLDEMTRIPGLFRRWELAEVLSPGQTYHFEAAGYADGGTPLFALYVKAADITGLPK